MCSRPRTPNKMMRKAFIIANPPTGSWFLRRRPFLFHATQAGRENWAAGRMQARGTNEQVFGPGSPSIALYKGSPVFSPAYFLSPSMTAIWNSSEEQCKDNAAGYLTLWIICLILFSMNEQFMIGWNVWWGSKPEPKELLHKVRIINQGMSINSSFHWPLWAIF